MGKIQRANLDGSQVEDLVTTGLVMAHTAISRWTWPAGKLYWSNAGTRTDAGTGTRSSGPTSTAPRWKT